LSLFGGAFFTKWSVLQERNTPLYQGYIVRFGQCSVFLIPINKRRRWKLVLSLTDGALHCTVVKSATIVKRSWNQEKCTLPWPCSIPAETFISLNSITR
jgi:hypothetical protein